MDLTDIQIVTDDKDERWIGELEFVPELGTHMLIRDYRENKAGEFVGLFTVSRILTAINIFDKKNRCHVYVYAKRIKSNED